MSDEPLVLPEQTRLTKKPEFDSETNEPNDNWTKTSNRLYQYLYPNKVSGPLQMAIILHVAHQTWGQKPKQLWCKLSRPRGCKLFNCTNQGWDNAVRDLLARGLVERLKVNDGIENGSRFRLGKWTNIRDYEKQGGPTEVPRPAPRQLHLAFRFTLFPGKTSGIYTVQIGDRELKIRYCNSLKQPAMLTGEVAPDGVLDLASLPPESKTEGGLPTALGRPSSNKPSESAENEGLTSKPRQNRLKFPSAPKLPEVEPHTIEEYRQYLAPLMRDRWGRALDDDFLLSIIKRAEAAPVAEYRGFVSERLKRDTFKKLGKEILWHVAADVAAARRETAKADAEDPWVGDGRGGWIRESARQIQPEQTPEERRAWLLSLSDEDYKFVIADAPELALPERAA